MTALVGFEPTNSSSQGMSLFQARQQGRFDYAFCTYTLSFSSKKTRLSPFLTPNFRATIGLIEVLVYSSVPDTFV